MKNRNTKNKTKRGGGKTEQTTKNINKQKIKKEQHNKTTTITTEKNENTKQTKQIKQRNN